MRNLHRVAGVIVLALAAGSSWAADTLRVGSKVLVLGDSAVRVIDLLGEPAYREPAENLYGAHYGNRWQYRRGSNIVTILIVDGKVAEIEDRPA